MITNTQNELIHFLSDMYSVEQQALAQMVWAPDIAGDAELAADFRRHHRETEQHAAVLLARLEAHGESPSAMKGALMKLGGKGFLLFARMMPESPGRLAAHAYAYEAMEWAGYEMLRRFAERADDLETAAMARQIGDEERAMMRRLESRFDAVETASHRGLPVAARSEDLRTHLGEAHALESQSIQLLSKGEDIAGDLELAHACRQVLEKSREHASALERRLAALGASHSVLKDAALGLGGLNWRLFFRAQSDTPAKLAAFIYAYLHLKIAGYELLRRTARRAADLETERLCDSLLRDEREMAERLVETFDSAAEATLASLGSAY